MKRCLIVLLALCLLIPAMAGLTGITAEGATVSRPFTLLNTRAGNGTNANVYNLPSLGVTMNIADDGTKRVTLTYANQTGLLAVGALKTAMDARPDGTRYVLIPIQDALVAAAEDIVYFQPAVAPLKAAFTEFFELYESVGGKLDGVYTDEAIIAMSGNKSPNHWYLHASNYSTDNQNVYKNITDNPLYQEVLRPLLEERGFVFHPVDPSMPERSEIYSVFPYTFDKYYPGVYVTEHPQNYQIWNNVMQVMVANCLNEAIYEPLTASFPEANMADRTLRDMGSWTKEQGKEAGGYNYVGGNLMKAGNTSSYDTSVRTDLMGGTTFPGYNGVSFPVTPFTQALWDVNQFKGIYASTDTGKVVAWLNDYGNNYQGFQADYSYYTELIYHLALTNVDTFFGAFYNEKEQHKSVSQMLAELKKIVGTADRTPIAYPYSWNYNFILSGMNAGGKAIWRITPDSEYVTAEAFQVSGAKDPTFTVNGQTVTFPGGKIITEGYIHKIGSNGYWVEMAVGTYPTVTCSADRYTENPSYLETFDTKLNATYWTQEGTPATATDGKLVMQGTTTLQNVTRPTQITAGDNFATQQAWKITVTIPAGLNEDAEVSVLGYVKKDTGFTFAGNKLYYDENGNKRELMDVDFAAGGTYTLVREVDFTVKGMFQCDYLVYDAAGKLLKKVENIAMKDVTLPYESIFLYTTKCKSQILLDDYALYPISHTTTFELFDAANGNVLPTGGQKTCDVGYRVSWLNATDKTEKAELIAAHYDVNNRLVSEEIINTLIMAPGTDGAICGVVEKKAAKVTVYLKEYDKAYVLTIGNSGRGAEGIGKYKTGTTVTVNAGNRPGYQFVGWTCDKDVTFADPTNPITTFVMPEGDTVVSATWELIVVEGIRPFVMTNWSGVDEALYSNIRHLEQFMGKEMNGQYILTYAGYSDIPTMAQKLKEEMDGRPEGTRWINGGAFGLLLRHYAEDVVYLEKGVQIMHDWLDEFLAEYKRIDGKLDGIALDIEYFSMESWFLYAWEFTENMKIYANIVDNPLYETVVRPLLVERGFKFYENITAMTPEIYSIYPPTGSEYAISRAIWDACMQNLLNRYQDESMAPLFKYYPDADVNDYKKKDELGWLKRVGEDGAAAYTGGNVNHMGTASSMNTYSYAPTLTFESSGGLGWTYNKMPSYNKAVYEDDPYNMFMWDVNECKTMRFATPSKQVSVWFAAYCYSPERPGSTSFTPYYAEAILHMGLMDPQPFLGFIVGNHDGRMETTDEYNLALQVASDILSELTRVVGADDRKPLDLPINWNTGYMLTGMYAGGYNYWRITPDTTDGMTKEAFLISKEGEDPTFSINGQTITFPGGEILEDGFISEVGTCGYWVRTSTELTMPTITYAENRYSMTPSFRENFEEYQIGMKFTSTSATNKLSWNTFSAMNGVCEVREDPNNPNNKVLAISGMTALKNERMPQNITAGDSFAKQQVWEVTITLPDEIPAGAQLNLLNLFAENFTDDLGIQIMNGKVYYDREGQATELAGVSLTGGTTYIIKRELNFTDAANFISSYYICDAEGNVLGEAKDVPILEMTLPVNGIGITCTGFSGDPILVDNYKLYPNGLTKEFEVYNANTGLILADQTAAQANSGAYRLSWLNATNKDETATVMAAYYDANGKLVSEEVVRTITLTANADGVDTGVVENKEGQSLKIYLKSGDAGDNNNNNNNQGGQTGEDGGSLGLIIGIAAGAVVLIAAVVVVLIVLKKKKK